MSIRDNPTSLAVEMAFELIPGLCRTEDEENDLWKQAGEYDPSALRIPFDADPLEIMPALLSVAAAAAKITLEDYRRLVLARHRAASLRVSR